MRRVTDTSIPEDEAFRAVEKTIVPMWKRAAAGGERRFWHEYFYELIQTIDPKLHEGESRPNAGCWRRPRAKLPIVVPGVRGFDLRQHRPLSHVKLWRVHR